MPPRVQKKQVKERQGQLMKVLVFVAGLARTGFAVIGAFVVLLIALLAFLSREISVSFLEEAGLVEGESTPMTVEDGSWIQFDLDYNFLSGGEISPQELVVLQRASKDDRIKGLLVKGNPGSVKLTSIQELAKAVALFEDKNTKLALQGDSFSVSSLYLMQGFKEVVISPASTMVIEFPTNETPFMKDFFEKLGVKASFFKSGPYKSAPDSYTESKMDSYQRENLSTLFNSRKEQLLAVIDSGGRTSTEEFEAAQKKMILSAEDMLNYGWVDNLEYSWQQDGEDETSYVPVMDYYRDISQEGDAVGIGLVQYNGMISGGSKFDRFIDDLKYMREEDEVEGILMQISSGGGTLYHSLVLSELIKSINDEKPVVVSSGASLASGAYLMAAPASYISANPMSIIGSIGVYGGKLSFKGLFELIGINWETVGKPSLSGDIFDFSKDQIAAETAYIRKSWQLFVEKVSEGRGMDSEKVGFLATGAVWTGKHSMDEEQGIVDSDGGLSNALDQVVKLAGGGEFYFVEPPREERGYLEDLLASIVEDAVQEELKRLKREFPVLVEQMVEEMSAPKLQIN